jgi:hypothetical protein
VVSGNLAAEITGIVVMAVVVLPLIGLRVGARHPVIRGKLVAASVRLVGLARRVARRDGQAPETMISEAMEQISSLRLTPVDKLAAAIFSVTNWGFDIACLAWAIKAVGLPIPWEALVLAWAAGAGAASFNVTPGGLGVVEPALAGALVAARLPSAKAMSAVLLYRFISFWFVLSVGWLSYALIRRRREVGIAHPIDK